MTKRMALFCVILLSAGFYSCDNDDDPSVPASTTIRDFDAAAGKLGGGYGFTEGPAVDKEGNIFFTDQPNNRILKWTASTRKTTIFVDATANGGEGSGRSNGMYFDAAGNLITCADMKGEIWSIDKNGVRTVIHKDFNGKILNGPNDIWINPVNGGMYITDPLYVRTGYWAADDVRRNGSQQGGGFVYYLSPDRNSFTRVAGTDFDQAAGDVSPTDPSFGQRIIPNGVVGSADGKKLYVGHIWPEKTYVYDINADGTLSNKKEFVNMRTDGMTTDEQGNIYLTNENGVVAFDKDGKELDRIPTFEGWTANCVFGDADRKTLFITALGSIYGVKMNVEGVVK